MIDATIGGAHANSYVTFEFAESYFAARFGADAWTALSAGDKEKALLQSCREIDRNRFFGFRCATPSQALQFPRNWPYNADDPIAVTAYSIPQSVQHAQCEQALWLAENAPRGGVSQRQQLQEQGVTGFGVGDLRETFSDAARPFTHTLCPQARQLLVRWIDRTGRLISPGREAMAETYERP